MKKFRFFLVMSLFALVFSCGGDDKISNDNNPENQEQGGEAPKVEERTVELPSSSWTDNGYFDGMLYYKIISDNPAEAIVSSCEKTATNALIPTWLKIDDKTYKVTDIANSAFDNCSSLISIDIPNSVTSIGNNAFIGCTSLTSVEIPNSVTNIGDHAFVACRSMTSAKIGNSVKNVGDGVFRECTNLTSIVIPNSVTNIGNSVFAGCASLTTIIVEKNNLRYDSRNNCNAIIITASNTLIAGCMNTVIPNSVTMIGNYAFRQCTGLTSIVIPNSITNIGSAAFQSCTNLTSVEIPNSVTVICSVAFLGCPLASVHIKCNNPPIIDGTVFNSHIPILYVPTGTKDKYATWNNFDKIVEE